MRSIQEEKFGQYFEQWKQPWIRCIESEGTILRSIKSICEFLYLFTNLFSFFSVDPLLIKICILKLLLQFFKDIFVKMEDEKISRRINLKMIFTKI